MKLKSKEEILNHIGNMKDSDYKQGFIDGIKGAFKYFAERVKFYKKYYNHRELFQRDYPNEWDKSIDFNWWLFDYCFGDVIE